MASNSPALLQAPQNTAERLLNSNVADRTGEAFPKQKSFGEFTRERFGSNWVFAHRATDRIRARYNKNDCPVVVITPKQQKQLHADYKREWGAEYDSPAWQALCALKSARLMLYAWKAARKNMNLPDDHEELNAVMVEVETAIEALTT